MNKYLLTATALLLLTSTQAADPTGARKKTTKTVKAMPVQLKPLIAVVPQGESKTYTLLSQVNSDRPISFMITDSRGVVVMFGDNYASGSSISLSHFPAGTYTVYFDRDSQSAAAEIYLRD